MLDSSARVILQFRITQGQVPGLALSPQLGCQGFLISMPGFESQLRLLFLASSKGILGEATCVAFLKDCQELESSTTGHES